MLAASLTWTTDLVSHKRSLSFFLVDQLPADKNPFKIGTVNSEKQQPEQTDTAKIYKNINLVYVS